MTLQEKKNKIEELQLLIQKKEEEIKETKKLADQYNASQLALKLVLNGSYGFLANKHAACFCNGVAATITAHGRDLIQYMERSNEEYWYKEFHLDIELHKEVMKFKKILQYIDDNNLDKQDIINDDKKLQELKSKLDFTDIIIPEVTPIDPSYVNTVTKLSVDKPIHSEIFTTGEVRRKEPTSVYVDTDSLFLSLKPAFKKLNIKKDYLDYVLFISKYKLEGYFKNKLEEYANKYSVKNIQDFELEQISKSIIYLEKKMYIKNVVWEEGVVSSNETNLQAKGIDLVRSSSSAFTREKVYDILKYFFQNPETYSDRELVKLVKNLKELFKLAPIDQISMNTSCSKYSEKVIDDVDSFKLEKGVHHGVKAACLHNYLLNQNPDYKQKYNSIKSGSKIKYYYTTNNLSNEFGYLAGQYPKELASKYAPIDYDTQFDKSILSIINRFCKVLDLSELTPQLRYSISLF